MPNYQNGKIYAIKSYQTELIYIGSTTRPLSQRLGLHRLNYKNNTGISSMELLKYSDYYIELIENFPCNSKEELLKREGYFIKQNINNSVNCCIPGRTYKEWANDNKEQLIKKAKEYRENNKKQIREKSIEYYESHKEHVKEYQNQYRENNKEQKKQKAKEYYQKNKEIKKQKAKEYYQKKQQNEIITDTQN